MLLSLPERLKLTLPVQESHVCCCDNNIGIILSSGTAKTSFNTLVLTSVVIKNICIALGFSSRWNTHCQAKVVLLWLSPLHPLKTTLLKYEVYWGKKVFKKITLEMKKWNRRSKMTRELSHPMTSHRIASSFSKNSGKMKAKHLIGTSTHTSTSRKNLLCRHKCYFETVLRCM